MDMSLDDVIKLNKAARSEAGSSGSHQRRGSSLNRVQIGQQAGVRRGKAQNHVAVVYGKLLNYNGGGAIRGKGQNYGNTARVSGVFRGKAQNWSGSYNQRQFVQSQQNNFRPNFMNYRGRGNWRGAAFAVPRGFQSYFRRGFGFTRRGGFGLRGFLYNGRNNSNASVAGSIAGSSHSERLVGPPPMRQYQPRFMWHNYQNRLSVHQRLGWMTPAQQIARSRLNRATQFLNERNNQYLYRHKMQYFQKTFQNSPYHHQQAYRQQQVSRYQQKMTKANYSRNNGRTSPTGSEISVVICNELAMQPRAHNSGQGRAQMEFVAPLNRQNVAPLSRQNVAPLSRQNVAQLPHGYYSSASAGPSNQSTSFASGQSQASRRRRNNRLNRAYLAKKQLSLESTTTTCPSLPALRRKLCSESGTQKVDKDGFALPTPPPVTPHLVKLDPVVQKEISQLQEKSAMKNEELGSKHTNDLNCRFLLASKSTTTSINDRFGMLTSLVNCTSD